MIILYQVKPKLFIILLEEMIRQFCRHICIHSLVSILIDLKYIGPSRHKFDKIYLCFLGGKTTHKRFKGEVVVEVIRCKLTLGEWHRLGLQKNLFYPPIMERNLPLNQICWSSWWRQLSVSDQTAWQQLKMYWWLLDSPDIHFLMVLSFQGLVTWGL